VETSVNPEALRRVADNAGVRIGGELFSDAMGEPGDVLGGFDTGTHDGMLRHNMATIVEGLRP
jgi:manganese/zinc/iron transport system substrate-binding protein